VKKNSVANCRPSITGSGRTAASLPLAKHTIDVLAMLKEKTAGGLDAEETRLLDGVLYELRVKYCAMAK